MLLSPYIPLLFMGEEYGEQRPFPFFCDFGDPGLQEAVRRGRKAEFAAFGWADRVPDPQASQTWASAKLSWSWPDDTWHAGLRRLYGSLLRARRDWSELQSIDRSDLHVTLNGNQLRMMRRNPDARRSTIDIVFNLSPEPQVLPHELTSAESLMRSEDAHFGGTANAGSSPDLLPFEFRAFRISGDGFPLSATR